MKRSLLLLLLLMAVRVRSAAQASTPNDDVQLWPDVTVGIKLTPTMTLNLFGTMRLGKHQQDLVSEQVGAAVIFRVNKYLSITPQYRHVWSQPDDLRHTQENRYFIDAALRLPLPKGFTLQDRNRAEIRDIEGKTSWRYRNRPQLEKAFTWHDRQLTAYLSGEIFYDSRSQYWSRKQFWVGTRVPVSKHLTLDFHYSRNLDDRARPGRLHIIGVFSRFEF
ncbi:MAG TPA: DUF2490 domain-containing protein [Blastocatellia bacterium]|nr:DUF2490 domain-containing protein [Blastocatellia bacterium]